LSESLATALHPHSFDRTTMRLLLWLLLLGCAGPALAQDYEREARWADETLAALVVGDPVWLAQKNGHRFLGLYTKAKNERGAVVIAHGRGWSPDYDLYGALRTQLSDAGYSTLSIQMPVLPSTAKIGDYLPTFPDADERLALAIAWLHAKGAQHVGLVSHSLGATMANHYLINTRDPQVEAWAMISIINGLEDMFRIKLPVLDVFAGDDWQVTRYGADERRAQIEKIAGSRQVVVAGAEHFFEGHREELTQTIVAFLDGVFAKR
jgi:pimeloyl-ACP methyl ester carboxylesterase